jgi:hypothetical protein
MAHSIRTKKREDLEERKKVASGLVLLVVIVTIHSEISRIVPFFCLSKKQLGGNKKVTVITIYYRMKFIN